MQEASGDSSTAHMGSILNLSHSGVVQGEEEEVWGGEEGKEEKGMREKRKK